MSWLAARDLNYTLNYCNKTTYSSTKKTVVNKRILKPAVIA